MSETAHITYAKNGDGVATITLNRPEKMNAFTLQMIADWLDFLKEADDDPDVKVVIVTGTGKGFCAGADIEETSRRSKTGDIMARKNFLWKHLHKLTLYIERMEKPLIGAINGTTRGAGCDLALLCDIRLGGESANFGWSYIKLGIIAGSGGTYLLPRAVGMDQALELFWTGRVVGSAEARQMGILTRVVPDAELQTAAFDLAKLIAAQPQDAVQFYRRAAYQGANHTLYSHLDMLSSHIAVLGQSRENRKSLDSFQEDRAKAKS